MGFFPGIQERVRNSRGKRAISVLATEVVLYIATVDSRYLEIKGTLRNTSRYPHFDISDL